MATRSYIWMKTPGGWRGIYCHWDGYPEYVGKVLKEHYTDSDKIEKLINLGDIAMLAPEICEKNDFDNPDKNCVLAYCRDGGEDWDDCAPKVVRSVDEAIDVSRESWAEYIYFWDGKQWNCYYYYEGEWVFGSNPEEKRKAGISMKKAKLKSIRKRKATVEVVESNLKRGKRRMWIKDEETGKMKQVEEPYWKTVTVPAQAKILRRLADLMESGRFREALSVYRNELMPLIEGRDIEAILERGSEGL